MRTLKTFKNIEQYILNALIRKYTKTKSVFPSDESLMKCLYLVAQKNELQDIEKILLF